MMMNDKESCSIYSHYVDMELIYRYLQQMNSQNFRFKKIASEKDGSKVEITSVQHDSSLTLTFRRKNTPGYRLSKPTEPITKNLLGMYNYVRSIETNNKKIKDKLGYKISSINTEIGFVGRPSINDFRQLVLGIADILDGIVFTGNNSVFRLLGAKNGIFNKNGELILDSKGASAVRDLDVIIEDLYYNE